jgi:LCP family protein required for cell wall assembly
MPAVSTAPPRRGAPRSRRRTLIVALSLVGAFVLIQGGIVSAMVWQVSSAFDAVEKIPAAFPTDDAARPPETTGTAASALNVLLLGSDNRGASGSLTDLAGQHSDTIVVVHIPADRQGLSVMSIPRDSWIDVPGHGETNISSTMSLGGVPLAVQAVEGLIGVRVDHVAVVDFSGFKAVTDALGGVSIDNPVAFDSYYLPGRYFPKGPQHLNGTEALAFVRERSAFPDGDMHRVRNQQRLIGSLLNGLLRQETLTNPATVGSVIGAVTPHLAIDETLDPAGVAALAVELREVRPETVRFFTIPVAGTGSGRTDEGHPIVNLDRAALPALQEAFRTDALDGIVPQLQAAG